MDDLPIYEEIIRLKKERQPAVLATVVESRGSTPRKAGAKMLVHRDGSISGTVGGGRAEADAIAAALEVMGQGRPRTLSFSLTEAHGAVCGGSMLIYLEPLSASPHLVVIGGGHVGRAVRQAASQAGFLVTLVGVAAEKSDPVAAGATVQWPLAELPALFTAIGADDESYMVIATSDHHQDFLAAGAALQTSARYIAVLGSRKKRAALAQYLAGAGIAAAEINRIIIPAGLAIDAETPAEIAVSIVAQMIHVRRTGNAAYGSAAAGSGEIATDGFVKTSAAAG